VITDLIICWSSSTVATLGAIIGLRTARSKPLRQLSALAFDIAGTVWAASSFTLACYVAWLGNLL
jgi:hypothetical protein